MIQARLIITTNNSGTNSSGTASSKSTLIPTILREALKLGNRQPLLKEINKVKINIERSIKYYKGLKNNELNEAQKAEYDNKIESLESNLGQIKQLFKDVEQAFRNKSMNNNKLKQENDMLKQKIHQCPK